jgi:hypothetical protein
VSVVYEAEQVSLGRRARILHCEAEGQIQGAIGAAKK